MQHGPLLAHHKTARHRQCAANHLWGFGGCVGQPCDTPRRTLPSPLGLRSPKQLHMSPISFFLSYSRPQTTNLGHKGLDSEEVTEDGRARPVQVCLEFRVWVLRLSWLTQKRTARHITTTAKHSSSSARHLDIRDARARGGGGDEEQGQAGAKRQQEVEAARWGGVSGVCMR